MSRNIPKLLIERVHLGEATSEQRARVLANPEARAMLDQLAEQDAAFLKEHPADAAVPQIEGRLRVALARDDVARRRRRMTGLSALLVPLAAAKVALVVVMPSSSEEAAVLVASPEPDGPVRKKGPHTQAEPELHVFRKSRGKVNTLPNRTVLRPGDLLQLGYSAGNATHGVLLSIDGRGSVTLHAPDGKDTSLDTSKTAAVLPHAYKLDDAPAFERFFLVTDDDRIDVDSVVRAAKTLVGTGDAESEPLPLPNELAQVDFTIRKDVP